MEGKLIIITSVLKIDGFFNGVFKEQKEPIVCKLHLRFEQDYYYASLFDDKKGDYSNEFEYVNPVATMYPKVELTSEERLSYINNLLVVGAKRTSKPEAPAPKSTHNSKEQDLQNKIDMLQRHNDLLMNELDKVI